MQDQQDKITRAKDTGMAAVLICLIGFLWGGQRGWIVAALVLLVLNMIRPQLYRPAAVAWFGFSHRLGGIVSKVVLSAIFYIVLTPVALVRRLTGADAMKLKLWHSAPSAFSERDHRFTARDLEKPY